jgi:hypothetical protein
MCDPHRSDPYGTPSALQKLGSFCGDDGDGVG